MFKQFVFTSFSLLLITTIIYASETPIIGILSQEAYLVAKAYPDAHSFIAASFVKILEAGGARVIPIWIGQDKAYYERVVNYTNGILFPGGGVYFNESGGYGEAAAQLYELATKSNEAGIYYPLWGVCLGMQVLMFAAAGKDIRGDCSSMDVSLPLNFEPGYKNSKLFSHAPERILDNLATKDLTYNYHRFCIFQEVLQENNLLNDWAIISKCKDKNGLEFVSSLEHKTYPYYGTQYHPEKSPYEFKRNTAVSHSFDAIEVSQYFANFFIGESKKNNNTFPTNDTERDSLIYNFNVTFSADKTSYEQLYLFKPDDYKRSLLLA